MRASGPVIFLTFDSKGVALSTQLIRRELSSKGIDASVCLATTTEGDEVYLRRLGHALAMQHPRILGVSLMSQDMAAASAVLKSFREVNPDGFIVAGGVHPTVSPAVTLRSLPVDSVIRGGGEEALFSLLEDRGRTSNTQWPGDVVDAAFTPPMSMKERSTEVLGPDRFMVLRGENLELLNQMEHAGLHHWNQEHYHTITGFGCPSSCTYCTNLYRNVFSRRHVGQVIEEIQCARQRYPSLKSVNFHDDSFVLSDDKWPRLFAQEYKKLGGGFIVRMTPKYVRHVIVDLLAKAGLVMVKIGLQGSDRLNRQVYSRKETSRSFVKAVSLLHSCGVRYEIDVILDNPYEKESDLSEIVETLNACPKPFRVHAYNLIPYTGTALRRYAESRGELERFACQQTTQSNKAYVTPLGFRLLVQAIPWLSSTQICALAADPYSTNALQFLKEFFSEEYVHRISEWTADYHRT